ncbi:serine hydrolase [Ferruginibacter sp.]|uniref:serine hydrolase domain-containing protein n=1 Tax=Ferruginibacter sp. TaxID=1940288 RepID=UPI0019CA6DF2|nr:serine hydrolase [Ferruginibacter sp.]MBC7629064.1 serine hydrolase [Ferruginibacter sp.]
MSDRRIFMKQVTSSAIGIGLLQTLPVFVRANLLQTASALPRSTSELQGISSAGISKFLTAIKASGQEFHSLMILRHGHVVAEAWWAPYSSEHRQQLYSLSKSFTGTAIGLAVAEGHLSVEDPVIKFFPELLPETVSDNLAALKVKHLLSMSVGHAKDSILNLEASPQGVLWEKTFLSLPVVFTPGSQFMYNSGASYMLSSIVKRVTGQTAHDYLKPRLYQPLEIKGATWTENFEGINMGASHLRMRTEDIAKFGQLYLQKGNWNGKQIIPEAWVTAASSKQIDNGKNDSSWGYGYGYQFWLNPPGGFRADGAFGQFSMVFPALDAVVAITSESVSTKITMQIVWDILLPEMKAAPLPPNTNDHIFLTKELTALKYDSPMVATSSAMAKKINGKIFLLDKNEFNATSVSFRFKDDDCLFILKEEGKPDIIITNGIHHWVRKGNLKPTPHSLFSLRRIDFDSIVAASATWQSENTLLLTWRFIETVHGDSITFIFDEDKLTIKFLFSVARLQNKPDERASITGKMVV